jgi:hypothetical protein
LKDLVPNTYYTVVATPLNTLQSTGTTKNTIFATLSEVITGLSSNAITATSVTLSWNSYIGEYSLLRWLPEMMPVTISSSILSYTIQNLTSNLTYDIELTPYNRANVASQKSSIQVLTLPDLMGSLTSVTSSNAVLTWARNDSQPGYSNLNIQLYQGSTSLSNVSFTYDSTIALYNMQHLAPNTLYSALLTSYGISGVPSVAQTIPITTLASRLQPLTFTQVGTGGNNYLLSWGTGDYSYVNISYLNNGIVTTQSNINVKSVEVSLSSLDTRVVFTVFAYNRNNVVSHSRSITFVSNNGVSISYG